MTKEQNATPGAAHCPEDSVRLTVESSRPRELLTSNMQLRFSMGNGQRVFTADNDGDIVRVTIKDGESRHEWFYLDKWEVDKLLKLLTEFAHENPVLQDESSPVETSDKYDPNAHVAKLLEIFHEIKELTCDEPDCVPCRRVDEAAERGLRLSGTVQEGVFQHVTTCKASSNTPIDGPGCSCRHVEPKALTNDQCRQVVAALHEQEWSGISNDDVRLWDGLIQHARSAKETNSNQDGRQTPAPSGHGGLGTTGQAPSPGQSPHPFDQSAKEPSELPCAPGLAPASAKSVKEWEEKWMHDVPPEKASELRVGDCPHQEFIPHPDGEVCLSCGRTRAELNGDGV